MKKCNENTQMSTLFSVAPFYIRSYKIMESCWKQCPADRPTFCEINRRLSDLIEQNNNNESYISMLGGSEVPIGSAEEVEETLAVEETATVSWRAETDNAIASLARSDHS